jgi:hypothetical protein
LYWLLIEGAIVVYDTERHTLGVIEKPANAHQTDAWSFQLLHVDDDTDTDVGLAVLSNLSIQLWKRESNCDGVVKWVMLQKIIQLEGLLPQGAGNG